MNALKFGAITEAQWHDLKKGDKVKDSTGRTLTVVKTVYQVGEHRTEGGQWKVTETPAIDTVDPEANGRSVTTHYAQVLFPGLDLVG